MDPDSLLHAHRKILLDTLRHPNQTATTDATQAPPPPAYSPTPLHPLPHPASTLLALPNNNNISNAGDQPYPTDVVDDDDDDDLPAPPQPPITIKIDSTTKIVGHGNVLAYSPSETATRVAAMLVAALRQTKVLEGGEPRPLEISVGAGLSVMGCRNVVGATGVRGKGAEKGSEGEGKKEEVESSGGGRKRGAEEDSAEMPRAKKVEMRDG